jgi:hypothetical protein
MASLPPDVISTLIVMSFLSLFFLMGFFAGGRGRHIEQPQPLVIVLPVGKKKQGKGKNKAVRREMNRELEQVLASVMSLLEDEDCGNPDCPIHGKGRQDKAGSWFGGPPGVFVRRQSPVDYDML